MTKPTDIPLEDDTGLFDDNETEPSKADDTQFADLETLLCDKRLHEIYFEREWNAIMALPVDETVNPSERERARFLAILRAARGEPPLSPLRSGDSMKIAKNPPSFS